MWNEDRKRERYGESQRERDFHSDRVVWSDSRRVYQREHLHTETLDRRSVCVSMWGCVSVFISMSKHDHVRTYSVAA